MISLFQTIKKNLPPIYCYTDDDFQASTAKNYRHPAKDPCSLLEVTPITAAASPLKKKRKWQRKYDSLSQSTTHIVSQPVKSKKNKDDDDPCLISDTDKSMEELLPPYTCSVKKTGKMYIKREMDHQYRPSKDRSWKKYYVHLHGTLLDAFTCIPVLTSERKQCKRKSIILLQHGLQGAKVGWACDYAQKPYILRIYSTITGEQVLLRPAVDDHNNNGTEQQEEKGLREMVEWIERIQAAINISMDIDEQKMPTFVTLARTHYRHHPNMATVVLDQSKLAVQTCPHRGSHTSSITMNNNNNKKTITKWRRGFKKCFQSRIIPAKILP
ncbi:unnamed protein product [Absidia cylindrospora]